VMDVLTSAGQESQRHAADAINIFERATGYQFIHTPPRLPAHADGFVLSGGVLRAVIEIKCRNMTRARLESFNDEVLMTLDKILHCRTVSQSLCVPFACWVYLIPERTLLVQRVINADGSLATELRARFMSTPATINGGVTSRNNAYFRLKDVKVFK
jgi:hypothetical protein